MCSRACRAWQRGASARAGTSARSLRRLISVHGRYSYMRMAQLVYYSFYKNLAFIFVQFWFGIYSGWSSQVKPCAPVLQPHPARADARCSGSLTAEELFRGWQVAYNEVVMTGFNLAITALPPFFLAIFERDIDERIIRQVRGGGRCAPPPPPPPKKKKEWHGPAALACPQRARTTSAAGRATGALTCVLVRPGFVRARHVPPVPRGIQRGP